MNVFAQIRKVDEAKRLVFGRACEEVVDKSGEIMDYATTKPYFAKWSEEVQTDTDGKSMGNLRAMHGKVAAGKLTEVVFDDGAKAIDVCAKVVDDQEWKKVLEGVYTGFSIGGSYVGQPTVEKLNGQDVKRYTANPTELSLVDRPCIPTAKFFDIQKADGSTAHVAFREPEAIEHDAGSVQGTPDQVDALVKAMAEGGIDMAGVLDMVLAKVAARSDVSPKEGTSQYGDVKFADERNKKYPVDTAEHIRAAWNYINKPANAGKYSAKDAASIKAKIVSAWKDKIGADGPPSASEKADDAAPELQKLERTPELRKSLFGCLCNVLDQLMYLRQSAAYEAFIEADNSPLPGRIDAVIALTAQVMQEAVDEAVGEVKAGTEAGGEEAGEQMELAERLGMLAKLHEAPMAALLERATDDQMKAAMAARAKQPEPAADLQKLLNDAMGPLQKALTEAQERIEHLEKQPAPARVSLRAISKAADVVVENHEQKSDEVAKVVDSHGKVNEAASLIKALHQQGGRPLTLRVAK